MNESVQNCDKHGVSYKEACGFCEVERRHSLFKGNEAQRKRDRFELAKAAMQGFVAQYGNDEATYNTMAMWSVLQADALLAELDKEPTE